MFVLLLQGTGAAVHALQQEDHFEARSEPDTAGTSHACRRNKSTRSHSMNK